MAVQTNGEGVSIDDNFAATKDVQTIEIDNNQLDEQQLLQQTQTKINNFQFKSEQFIAQTSNGPSIGPSYVKHMDQQQSNDQPIVTDHFQQQQNAADNDLLNAIVSGTETNNQLDCVIDSNMQATVEQLLAGTHPQDFQQLQQELLQQQTSDQELNFALQENQFQSSQPMDLLMSDEHHQSQQITNMPTRNDDGSGNQNAMAHPMQSEMDQMLDIDFMHQVFNSLGSERTGENLDDLALFNDINDVMNIGLDDVVSTSMSRESRTQEMLGEIEKKREQMIRDCDFMMRRLRKIQARHMARHISEEVGGLFEYAQQQIKRKERETKSISTMTPINQLHSDKQKMNWKMLLKRIEHAAHNQHSNPAVNKMLNANSDLHHANNSGLSASGAANKPSIISCVPSFDVNGYKQLRRCAGMLSTELKMVGRSFDPDATESSSDADSGDEGKYPNQTKNTVPIAKRAAYRWARDRAKIASRWSWLLAQITDLEYRIRLHRDIYSHLQKSNGPVTFEGEPVASTSTSEPMQPPSVNGYRGLLPGNGRLCDMDDITAKLSPISCNNNNEVELDGSARTRAFKSEEFKKRKLFQSTNLHKISRRAARPCTIKCGCRWPVHPCLLCTGRTDPTAPRDLPDMMSHQENVALLDPCYHPILSFPDDVPQNIYMEATLRTPEWQARVARASSKAVIKNALALQKASERDEARNNLAAANSASRKNSETTNSTINSKKQSSNKLKQNTSKVKKSPTNRKSKKASPNVNASKVKKNKSRKNSHMSATSSDHHDMDVGSPNGPISRSKNPSPIPGNYRYDRTLSNRQNKNAYDIDNIVIPSTVSSRVEIISYKEIPTPKWRVIEDETEKTNTTSQKEPEKEANAEKLPELPVPAAEEDISNEAYVQRHERALNEERKRFITFLKFPYSTRSRANRRIDSQSSGANTPDPMSPAPSTPAAATNIDQESAPPTPQSVDVSADVTQETGKHNNNNSTSANNNGGVLKSKPKQERRRTTSTRKAHDQREELLRRSTTPDIKELTPPYEPLNFPLPGETLDQMIQSMPKTYKDIIHNCIDQVTGEKLPTQSTTTEQTPASTPTQTTTLAPNCKSRLQTQQYSDLAMLVEDSDEDTELPQEDANDPEWNEPPQRIQKLQ